MAVAARGKVLVVLGPARVRLIRAAFNALIVGEFGHPEHMCDKPHDPSSMFRPAGKGKPKAWAAAKAQAAPQAEPAKKKRKAGKGGRGASQF